MMSLSSAKFRASFILLVCFAILIKLVLFSFTEAYAPQGKILSDSKLYIDISKTLVENHRFAHDEDGVTRPETFRTPGYPLFLGFFHNVLRIPLSGIVFIQILLTIFAAFFVFKTVLLIDASLARLSALILLFDIPVSIFSLTILSETLFLFVLSVLLFTLISYLKTGQFKFLLLSAFTCVAAAYIRPIAYYLGIALAFFIIYANRESMKKGVSDALVFFAFVYLSIGLWQVRNYFLAQTFAFSGVAQFNLQNYSLFHNYERYGNILMPGVPPALYYANLIARSLLNFFTSPGSLKYFNCHNLIVVGKIIAYPWMVFWLIGFLASFKRLKDNIYIKAIFFLVFYFTAVSIVGVTWLATDRFRAPIMPFIAILSAYGWSVVRSKK